MCCDAGVNGDEVVKGARVLPQRTGLLVTKTSETIDPMIEVIEPGLVLLHGAVSTPMQYKLFEAAKSWGDRPGEDGFYTRDSKTGASVFNAESSRGRIYDHIDRFPTWVHNICESAVARARETDANMPTMACTHLLLNYYTSCKGLQWHRDIYENDGTSDHPIVNVSIGSSCRFQFKHFDEDPDREVVLMSGDVLLFGGPCRYIKHTVQEVLLDDLPESWPYGPGRLSFTFRDAPEAIGREEEFKYFKPSEHLISQHKWEESYKLGQILPLIGAQPSQLPKDHNEEPLSIALNSVVAGA